MHENWNVAKKSTLSCIVVILILKLTQIGSAERKFSMLLTIQKLLLSLKMKILLILY